MCVKVNAISKEADGSISHLGATDGVGQLRWGLAAAEVIAMIESGEWDFYVERPVGDRVEVAVRRGATGKYLTSIRDDVPTNNLSELPLMAAPIGSLTPPFPLAYPRARRPQLVRVERPGSPPVQLAPNVQGHYPVPTWTAAGQIGGVFVTCLAPYPAEVEVFVDHDPTSPGYNQNIHRLDRVYDSGPHFALEDQGKGWFFYGLQILDSDYPRRFTPFRVFVRPPKAQREANGFTVLVRSVGSNPDCSGPSDALAVMIRRANASYAPPFVPKGGTSGKAPTPRTYAVGAFVVATPTLRNVGQTQVRGDQKASLRIVSAAEVGLGGVPRAVVFTDAANKQLAQPVGFAIADNIAFSAGGRVYHLGGAAFSPAPQNISDLGIVQSAGPGIGGVGAEYWVYFVKLGAASSQALEVECFLSKAGAAVDPRVLVSPDAQLAVVVDANRAGASLGRVRLLDLANRARPIGPEIAFDGTQVAAQVVNTKANRFAVRLQFSTGPIPDVLLPT